MYPIRNIFKLHTRNTFLWFILPWMVLGCSFLINLLIAFLLGGSVSIYTGGLASIYVIMLVIGVTSLHDTFPFAISFSVRRTDYLLGTLLTALVVCAGSAFVLLLFSALEQDVAPGWGMGLHFFTIPYLSDGNLPEQYLLSLFLLIHAYLLGFTIGCIYRRFGKTGVWICLIALMAVATIVLFLFAYVLGWGTIPPWFQQHTAFELGTWTVPLLLGYALFSYGLLRRATT